MKKVIASIVAATLFLSNAAFLPHSVLVPENFVILANSAESNEYAVDLIDLTYNYFNSNIFDGDYESELISVGQYSTIGIYNQDKLPNYKIAFEASSVKDIKDNDRVLALHVLEGGKINESVKIGMTYNELKSIFGFDGVQLSGGTFGFGAWVNIAGTAWFIQFDVPESEYQKMVDEAYSDTSVSPFQVKFDLSDMNPKSILGVYSASILDENNSVSSETVGKEHNNVTDNSAIETNESIYTELDLKGMIVNSSGYALTSWDYADYDSNGTYEGFALFNDEYYYFKEVRFIDSEGKITIIRDEPFGMFTSDISRVEFMGRRFASISSALGQAWRDRTLIYGVKDNKPYELALSGEINGLYVKDGKVYTNEYEFEENHENNFWAVPKQLGYDKENYEFTLQDEIINNEATSQNTNTSISESDKEMISEVEKYCSDKDYEFRDRINEVLNSNTSWEIKQNELLKILSKYGVNDIQEGMTYLRNRNQKTADALPYVYNYEFLVNDQIYCSSNFYDWLMSSYGMGARLALQTSSLIFNHEIMDVAFGDLFTDDPIGSNPSAKRNKKMLIDFLQDLDSDNNDSFGDQLKGASDLTEVFGKEFELYQDYNKDFKAYVDAMSKTDEGVTLYLPNLSSFLGYSSATFKFAGATINDVEILANMDNQVAIYERNRKFLETIRDSRNVSVDMRRAAGSLLDDITNGFNKTINHIMGNACQFVVEAQLAYFDDDLWAVALEELGIKNASSYLATYSVGVFITNALTGINKFTEEVAYSLGYAELSKLYSQKLKSDREEFLKDQSKEKAWQFFEDYTILWNLRYSGEEQYLKSQKVEGLFSSVGTNVQYLIKSLVAEETQSRLEEAKFYVSETIIIPDSVQYMKKAIIHCPVDVYVYKGDELVATLKDGTESDVTNSYGRFSVVYNPCTDEYEKVICQSTDDDFDLKIVAVDTGIVNAELAHLDSSDNLKVRFFDNELISNKDIVELSTDISNNNYTIDKSGDGNIDATKSLNESSNTYTPVTNITCSNDSIEIVVGNNMALDYSVSPDNATYKSVQFVSDDSNIIEVKAGKILAKSVGTTTIYVISSDNSSIKSEIKVNVIEQKHSANGTKKPILIGGIFAAVVVIVVIMVYKVRRKR